MKEPEVQIPFRDTRILPVMPLGLGGSSMVFEVQFEYSSSLILGLAAGKARITY